ncbi:hypothetical protein Q6A51_26255 [Pseudomonas sp. KFB-139]|uniref:Uncharacterized protein n=1 Tax=Pseudomonas serbiensis TaxID=3064350 RepID=A0ABT9D0R4_9PSED|nr:hypothetical protein [Pseudomonas sp. KFB-138]MDO7930276.1 hypothetical protein [Pseudomonas sp. KFB-138]
MSIAIQILHTQYVETLKQYPVVLTTKAWKRFICRDKPYDSCDLGFRLAIVIQAAHEALNSNAVSTHYLFGMHLEVADVRHWVMLQLNVVSLPGEPSYLHISLLDESQNLDGEDL